MTEPLPYRHLSAEKFGNAIRSGTASRAMVKSSKRLDSVKAGTVIELTEEKEDGSIIRIGMAPATGVHTATIDQFGMTLHFPDSKDYRAPNNQSIATLFGFEKFEHMVKHLEDNATFKKDGKLTTHILCWDPGQMTLVDPQDPNAVLRPPTEKATEKATKKQENTTPPANKNQGGNGNTAQGGDDEANSDGQSDDENNGGGSAE